LASFSHPSEEWLSLIFSSVGIKWTYEPREFILEFNRGEITSAFRPDFYLSEFDLYVEVTVMKPKLLRKKKQKLKKLRELYPEFNFKILYRGDLLKIFENPNNIFEVLGCEKPADLLLT
jgi:hypothetical protein